MTLTYDLFFRKLCLEHISNIILGRNPEFGVCIHRGMVNLPLLVTLTLTSDLFSRLFIYLEHISYITKKIKMHSGSVVECLSRDGGAAGSSLSFVTVLCP